MGIPNILYLTHRVPHPPNRGDRIRTYNMLKYLSRRAKVFLGCLADEPVSQQTFDELHRLCAQVAVVPVDRTLRWGRAFASFLRGQTVTEGVFHSPALHRIVAEWAQATRFDAALASSSALAHYLRIPEMDPVPAFVDLIDVDSQKWLDYSAESLPPLSWFYRREGKRLRRLERSLTEWTQGLAVVSEAEGNLFREFCVDYPICAIPNGVDLEYFCPASCDHNTTFGCVFVGALDYKPNVDGVRWLCREVWPGVRERFPQMTLQLVGREPTRDVRRLGRIAGVDVVGTVPDVRPYLSRAAVAVLPLQIARGVQNKLLEALAMGKAVVSSPEPVVGLDIEHGIHLRVAKTPGQWIESISELVNDPSQRNELGLAGLAYVTTHHAWERCLEPLSDFLGLNEPLTKDVANRNAAEIQRPFKQRVAGVECSEPPVSSL